jgi:hypothetical protein
LLLANSFTYFLYGFYGDYRIVSGSGFGVNRSGKRTEKFFGGLYLVAETLQAASGGLAAANPTEVAHIGVLIYGSVSGLGCLA